MLLNKKTDYRNKTGTSGGGMMGFYSNLLTKNIAMGSSVEDTAISAYTAGSKRQLTLLEGKKEAIHLNNESNNGETCASNNVDTSNNKIKSETHDNAVVIKSNGSAGLVDYSNIVPEHETNRLMDVSQSTPQDIAPIQNIIVAKPSMSSIQSAKERYLARMQANKVV